MQQGVPVYTPSWFSATGESATEEYDWGLITATPTQLSEDWGPINTNDETIPKVAENWGFLLGEFNYVQVGGQHYPNRDTFSVGESSLVVQTSGTTGVATFLLSEDLDIAAAIQYESSGITGIATYKAGINIFGANWFSQAPQHTVFGEEGAITIGISTANESITPFIPEGSGSLFTIGGAAESSTKAYLVGDYQFISGAANVNFAPHITGVGTGTFSQGREPYQTYARKINIPDDEFGGTISLTGNTIFEKNTDSYNESSILFGTENEDYGLISVEDVGRGFSLSSLGIGLTSVESLDAADITFDNSQQTGLTYDEAVGGPGVLPSFDKNQQYNVRFDSNVVAEDRGILGISSVGGRPYTRLYPSDTGFDQQEINNGYEDAGFITDPAPRESQFPFGKIVFPRLPAKFTQFIPSWIGSGTLNVSGTSIERVAVASSTTSLFDFVSGADERFIAQTPEGTVLFDISDTANESVTKDFVGSGSITLESGVGITTYRRILDIKGVGSASFSGSGVIRSSFDPPEGTYLHIFGDGYSDFKVSFATQSQKATLRLVGELTHPDIDFTPHYGIDRNIGIETGMFLLPGGGLNEDGTGPGIVTTRFLPKYPATGRITIDGKAIGRTNAPILTDGTIYILGIGTEGNGQIGDDGIGDLNGVEFGAKERFVPATEFGAGSLLFDFQTTGAEARPVKVFGYYGDDKDPGTSGQITIRQEGGILTIERTVVPEIGSGTFTYSGAGQGEATTSVEIGSGSLFAIGGIAESTTAAELVAGTSIFNGTAEESFSAQTPEDTATITLSGTGVAQRRFGSVGSGTLTLSNDQRVVTGIILSPTGSGTFSILGGAAEQQSNHLLQEQFLQISQVLQKQDTSKYSKTSFHLVHSHYLENSHIQRSTSHQRTLDLELLQSLDLPTRWILSERLVLVLQPSLVQPLSESQQTIWKEQSSSIQKALLLSPHSIKFTDTTETTEIQAHLVLLQSLVLVLQNQYKSLVTTETTKILAHRVDLHSPILLSYTHLSITHLRLALVLQSFTRQVEQLANPSPSPTTRLKEDSKDLLDLRNLSLVQLTLELVRLIPSEAGQTEYAVIEEGRTYVVII